jgi:hypothetical protein
MLGAEPAQFALALRDLCVELVGQAQAGLDRALPGLWQGKPREQLATAQAEEVGDGAGLAVGEQDGVHALHEGRAVAHEMQPPARPLALGANERVGQPDRRHAIAAGELGQYPGVDAIGLAGQGRQSLHLLRVRDLDLPAVSRETDGTRLRKAGCRPLRRLPRGPPVGTTRGQST